jgi:hypothetical protein
VLLGDVGVAGEAGAGVAEERLGVEHRAAASAVSRNWDRFYHFKNIFSEKLGKKQGRCYDHNFLRFLTIFGKTIGVFLKNQCYDQNFA